MNYNLNSSTKWDTFSTEQNILKILAGIKYVTFKFEDRKYPLFSIHQAK